MPEAMNNGSETTPALARRLKPALAATEAELEVPEQVPTMPF